MEATLADFLIGRSEEAHGVRDAVVSPRYTAICLMRDPIYSTLRILFLALIAVWGCVTFMAYIGTPVHLSVLLNDAGKQTLAAACGTDGGVVCRSTAALWPIFSFGILRLAPLALYLLVSLLAVAAWITVSYRSGRDVRATVRPWMIAAAFVASIWLVHTSLSFAHNGAEPFTRLYEPSPAVYQGLDEEGMTVLEENFAQLQGRGCLTEIGTVANGQAKAYSVSRLCMQTSFFTRVLPHIALLFVLLLTLLSLGRALLRLVCVRMPRIDDAQGAVIAPLLELAFSAGLGAGGMIALLWLFAHIGLYSAVVGWALLLAIPVLLYTDSLYWLRSLANRRLEYHGTATALLPWVTWLLIGYLAFNFLNVVRPFPIGWDDLGKYVNQPRLLVSYGAAIPQLGAFMWEYLTSLGFLLFGYSTVFGATFSLIINWMAGLLAIVSIYAVARTYLGPHRGVLSALLYYTLPMVGHFSFADMKVDNAVFAFGALSLLGVFLAAFPTDAAEEASEDERTTPLPPQRERVRYMILAGLMGAMAFAIKPTSIMSIMASGTVLFGALAGAAAFLSTFSLAWWVYLLQGRLDLIDISRRITGAADSMNPTIIGVILLVIAIAALAFTLLRRRRDLWTATSLAGVFLASFVAGILPWIAYNNVSFGNAVPQLIFTSKDTLTPVLLAGGETPPAADGRDIRVLPEDLQVDFSQCRGTGKQEELDRYWGYRTGWTHYLTLPWRAVMNTDSAGYYVTLLPILLFFPLLLCLPFAWTRRGRWALWLWLATLFMLVQWMLFANGIVWYGIGTFLGLTVLVEVMLARAPEHISRTIMAIFIALSLFLAYSMRFWQYEMQSNIFEYPLGKVSYETMRERTIPHYDDIREMIDALHIQRPERPYVYRMGTFISYFIPRNPEVLPISDHQLDFFNCLYVERDPQLTLRRLQALGFSSMIFDTNTQTIESDPNGSLHQKVNAFVDFINTPGLGINVMINDPNRGIAFMILP